MRTESFFVEKIHCTACAILIESELKELPFVHNVKVALGERMVEVSGNFEDKTQEELVTIFNERLAPHHYTFSLEARSHKIEWSQFKYALPFALGFIGFFILLQKLGIVNLVTTDRVNYGTALLIGLIASVSTCMAVVGGLILSMSLQFAKGGETIRPQAMFHIGRLIAFFVLGGLIGVLGSAFQVGQGGLFILSMLVGLVMLVLGLNLLDVIPWIKKIQPTLPRFFSQHIFALNNINHFLIPFCIGALTFFLPCGFTQSMQIYALSLGNFWESALIMFFFALGTLPVLSLLSFSSFRIHKKAQSGVFFKTAGLVVIFFALFNIINSLVAIGIFPPLFNF